MLQVLCSSTPATVTIYCLGDRTIFHDSHVSPLSVVTNRLDFRPDFTGMECELTIATSFVDSHYPMDETNSYLLVSVQQHVSNHVRPGVVWKFASRACPSSLDGVVA